MNEELHVLFKKLNKEISAFIERDEIETQQEIREKCWERPYQEEYMKNLERVATDLYLLLTHPNSA